MSILADLVLSDDTMSKLADFVHSNDTLFKKYVKTGGLCAQ